MISPRAIVLLAALVAGLLIAMLGQCSAHDEYMDWRQPGTGMSCCSGNPDVGDCYQTEARFEHGHWLALRREDKRWLSVPDNVILKDFTMPDGEARLCAPRPITPDDVRVHCFRPPLMGT
jgi:hypothetical protein